MRKTVVRAFLIAFAPLVIAQSCAPDGRSVDVQDVDGGAGARGGSGGGGRGGGGGGRGGAGGSSQGGSGGSGGSGGTAAGGSGGTAVGGNGGAATGGTGGMASGGTGGTANGGSGGRATGGTGGMATGGSGGMAMGGMGGMARGGSGGTATGGTGGMATGGTGGMATGGTGGTALPGGLVMRFRLDEGTGNAIKDATGMSPDGGRWCWDDTAKVKTQDGTKCGNGLATWSTGCKAGACLNHSFFNYEEIPDSAAIDGLRTAFTITAWVRRIIDHSDNRDEVIAHRKKTYPAAGANYNDHFRLVLSGGIASIHTDFQSVKGTKELPVNEWHHIAATFDGNTLAIYTDGNMGALGDVVTKAIGARTLGDDSTPVTLGCEDEDGTLSNWLDAAIDDVMFFNRALSPAEVASLAK